MIGIIMFLFSGIVQADTPAPGEEALFTTSTAPDALILLDLSGSMDWNPAGDDKPYGHSLSCTADTTYCTGSGCTGGFCGSSKTGCSINCSRLAIAKRAIFSILDDNNDGTINASDEGSLGVRIGYMRYYNCSSDDTGGSYTSGCIQIPGSSSSRRYIGSKYSQIYCANSTSCTMTSGSSSSYCVNGESASGGTPLASAQNEAKIYLDAHKAADSAKACRQKFVIFVTDGSDTYACSGSGAECQSHQYKRRRASVEKAMALADAGYRVFVIGFGSTMPPYLQNTLNWMAYYGGTDNPGATNSAITTAYDPSTVTSCGADSAAVADACYDSSYPYPGPGTSTASFRASSNDPGYMTLSGYAFLAENADQLAAAMKTAITIIREATYSFSQASVQSSRTQDENFLYEGSFQPVPNDTFWLGHLKKFRIKTTAGEACGVGGICGVGADAHECVIGDVCGISDTWGADGDAGTVLQATPHSSRTMYTCIGTCSASGTLSVFSDSIDKSYFAVSTDAERDAVVGYFQGNPAYNPDNWKLGDVFRSTPITVGTPSAFFDDVRDANNAFATHRTTYTRSSLNGKRLIVAGANDGQFHAFKTSNGSEAWSFFPPNLLPKLKNIYHTGHPTSLTHQYFVDGPVTVADVWLGSGSGTGKSASEWKTILVFGEGRGSTDRLWSTSASCDTGLVGLYDASHTNYCGYYALDITESLSPKYLWKTSGVSINTFNATTQAPYMGESWSRMMTGKVRYSSGGTVTEEKWVGFIGGGYNGGNCTTLPCDTRGKGFFVINLENGSVLWSYTLADNTSMVYSMPGQPAIVDTDNDGFIDTAYLGDIGGNVWRLTFCRDQDTTCSKDNWGGSKFFNPPSTRPIYTGPSTTKDTSGNLWVYWGTGDKTDPTGTGTQDYFYAVKDLDRVNRTSTYSSVDTLTGSQAYDPQSINPGFRIQLGTSEKVLSDSTVFGGVAYFTTFTPSSSTDPCDQGGTAILYGIKYTTGGGALPGNAKSKSIGAGIASAPVLSLKPGSGGTADLYVTVSGGGGVGASTSRINMNPPGVSNRTNMLYWLDRRLQ